ncbi:Ca2+-dependent lipid-binding protein [Encephalitozoon intestinalis ATCC 50506]|uniref:Ca2+-dependent lipid-binding protein n=1 Tax=Encephalitozoon intestinalis (strain ATCC 50506) TaxID=876142 RepID=E0S5J5_ENCIT|nr:Ca2+-dependent lipid-binding protein [Encephalitozoon intestinalis ATCC 50506]ADM10980.1 Ca2+-dependent lipid-binding protein [Encephalitozoon intestinalis ATCC 50506]UTX44617.1 Ca2+-dependent lipid-binding protein [Encephalitozoon intestinalis]
MEEFSTTSNRREKLSKPLLPEDIPKRVDEPQLKIHERSVEEFQDILDIEPKEGLFFYIRIPGLIFVGSVVGYIIGKMGFSIVNLFFVGYVIFFIYNRKVERFTRSLKSLVYHSARREKARNNGETVEWLNYALKKFWEVAEPVISAEVYQQVNNELLKVSPPFLNGLRLIEFTLGSRSPFIEGISYISMDGNTLAIEVEVAFVPLEISRDVVNYLENDSKNWNSKIQLSARVGTRNGIGINLPILVKELFFKGRVRIVANLFSKNMFVKDVEICLMDSPEFDFTLVPLKMVDIMDVPGLSRWIRSIINSSLATTVINPNSMTIDVDRISKDKGKIIGVVCLQILNLENEDDERLTVEIDVDGRVGYQTRYGEGKGIVYNEHFYMPIENVDSRIGLSLRSESRKTRRRNGSIFLKNLPLDKIEESVDNEWYEPRRTFFCSTRLVKDEQTYSFVNTNLQFYPIQKERSNSGIVKMTLVGIEDLRGNKASKAYTYSTFCTVIVSPINREESSIPIGFIENTVSATAMMMSGIVKTTGNMISNIIPGIETTTTRLLPSSKNTFYVFESKRIFGTNSPIYNESFTFFCRDIQVDVVSICVMNDKTSEVIGRVSIPVRDIHFNKKEKYKLNDAHSGRMELSFTIDYVDMVDKEIGFVDYERMLKISVDSMNEKGVYYAIFETNTDCFRMETFTSALPIKRRIYVPVQKENSLRFRLYKETINGDVFIGEDKINCSPCDGVRREAFLLDEQISLTLSIEEESLRDYSGAPDEKNNIKVIQAKFGKFYGYSQEMFIEFSNKYGAIGASGFTRGGKLNDTFTFIAGNEEIYAIIKSGDQTVNQTLGQCIIPKRTLKEKVMLNEHGLSVDMEVKIQGCSYKPASMLKTGYLEVYIKNGSNIRSSVQSPIDTYCKILVNETKVYTTKPVRKNNNPVFNESFIMEIDKTKDVFGIQICDYNVSERNALLYYTEFSLHNLSEGFSEMEFGLFDGKTFQPVESKIRIGFNFCADHKSLKIRKKGILSDFFGF